MQDLRIGKVMVTGSSLCLVIPKEILTALNIRRGDLVYFQVPDDSHIVVTKLTDEDLFKLKQNGAN